MENIEPNDQSNELDVDAIKGQKVESIMQNKDIQSLFSTFCNAIKKTFSKMSKLMKQASFLQIKNIDLCQAMKGTVFKTQLNQLCDIKQIISCVKLGFSSLQCDDCNKQAIVACEGNKKNPFKLFCESHFEEDSSYFKSSINLISDFRLNVIILNELEGHLIHLQEKIEYFKIQKNEKNPVLYQKVNGLIDDNFEELNTLLKDLASKGSIINQK